MIVCVPIRWLTGVVALKHHFAGFEVESQFSWIGKLAPNFVVSLISPCSRIVSPGS